MDKKTIISELIDIANECDEKDLVSCANEITAIASSLSNARLAWGGAEPPDSPPDYPDPSSLYETNQDEINRIAVEYALNDAGSNFDESYLDRIIMQIAQVRGLEPIGNPAETMNRYNLQSEVGSYIESDPSAADYITNEDIIKMAQQEIVENHDAMIADGPQETDVDGY